MIPDSISSHHQELIRAGVSFVSLPGCGDSPSQTAVGPVGWSHTTNELRNNFWDLILKGS